MTDLRPVRVYSLKVPPGEVVEANPGLPASVRITMASIDPEEEVDGGIPRAVLRMYHDDPSDFFDPSDYEDDDDDDEDDDDNSDSDFDINSLEKRLGSAIRPDKDSEIVAPSDDEEEDEDDDDDDDDDDEEDEAVRSGPSDPKKLKRAKQIAILQALRAEAEAHADEVITNGINGVNGHRADGMNGIAKGKGRANEALEHENDRDNGGIREHIVCTIDPSFTFQLPLDLVIGERETIVFRNSGTCTIYLTGNFVVPPEDIADDSDLEEDSEDEMDDDIYNLGDMAGVGMDLSDEESEEDLLDSLADPRVMELDEVDEEEEPPKLVKVSKTNKRAADDVDNSVESITKKDDKPQAKKLKNNAGAAVAGADDGKPSKKEKAKKDSKKDDAPQTNGKKVQFAEKLEQGPTPSKNGPSTTKAGPRTVNGVTIDDKKQGTGPVAKAGDKVGMRYIGKLKDGRQFDSNKKGKPFSFKIGAGEVIKGWDIGVQGMSIGGERRIIVPAKLGYGSKALPSIPANSELTFDLKMISIN